LCREAAEEVGREAAEEVGREAAEEVGREAAEEVGREAAEEVGRFFCAGFLVGKTNGLVDAIYNPDLVDADASSD